MKTDMTRIMIGTMLFVCAAVCAGYFIHRAKSGKKVDVKDILYLKDIFDWVDELLPQIQIGVGEKLVINILPNSESQALTKVSDRRVYVAILQKDINGKKQVLKTKVFYANTVDKDLSMLNKGSIVEIPIE